MKLYLGEVRSLEDPTFSGCVKVRVYTYEDDENNIKDDDLRLCTPLHPITSAATAGVGIIPTGLVVGSRVIVSFMDSSEQIGVILGSLGRGDLPSKSGVRNTPDEDSGGKIKNPAADVPGNEKGTIKSA